VAILGVAPAAVDFSPANDNAKAQRHRDAKVLADGHHSLRLGVFASLRLIPFVQDEGTGQFPAKAN
jgi:hypothetical protein